MEPLLIHGMHGLGDNLRQRAVVRQLMRRHDVWLESPWVSVYHDLVAAGLKVVHAETELRTQARNARREAARFSARPPPPSAREVRVWYLPDEVRRHGSVMAAMCAETGCDAAAADFRLPVPGEWAERARGWLRRWGWDGATPILVYRPLVMRTEWGGCAARNPDEHAYAALLASVRERFFVVSVADLAPGVEWITGVPAEVDAACHRGELDFETLAGLTSLAGMVFCSPGFAGVLGQAVGVPVVCVFGGYERSAFFFDGARSAPVLGIDPVHPCECFRHDHACRKAIDLPAALARLGRFAAEAAERAAVAAGRPPDRLERADGVLPERG